MFVKQKVIVCERRVELVEIKGSKITCPDNPLLPSSLHLLDLTISLHLDCTLAHMPVGHLGPHMTGI